MMIFDLYSVVSNFAVNRAHNLNGPFFQWLFLLRRLCLKPLLSDELESSLDDGSDESVFMCLCIFSSYRVSFFYDESDNDGFGSG